MILVTTKDEADATRKTVQVHGQPYQLREYIGAAPLRGTYIEGNESNDNELPQGFLVNQPPDSITPAHFHEHDQFQVFVAGSARLGKKRVDPLSVQFAGAHTPYGPIVADSDGVEYYTLRKRWDAGAKYMPKMREYLVRGQQRQLTACVMDLKRQDLNLKRSADNIAGSLPSDKSNPACVDIIGPEPDGLLASVIRLQADEWTSEIDPCIGDGQYHVVLEGSIIHERDELPHQSCQFVFADEVPFSLQAGTCGATLLMLRFPR